MEKQRFSIFKALNSFKYACNGLKVLFQEENNAKVHLLITVMVIVLSFLFGLNTYEWIAIVFSIGFVIATEIINSAIEDICNFIHPGKDDGIKKIKDLSAAAVFVSALTALAIGLIIFVPKILNWL
ncbi:MAG: diacylglycerol kinase family protein [Chitinophagaceae bacterium]|nr:diacylglycerol kinase family protein [Chitinophagaceae bacterium]